MAKLSVSVCIPTLGREKELIDTVEALLGQTILPDEIIIVDQNDPPSEKVIHFLKDISFVKHLTGAPPGVVPNYNRCLRAAMCEIVVFLDDDVIPTPTLIENHLQNYLKSDGVKLGGVAGRINGAFGDPDPLSIKKTGFYNQVSGSIQGGFNGLKKGPVDFAQGANMSYRRKYLLEVGGFDPIFDGNGYFFEPDVGLRLKKAGYPMCFDPEAELIHLMAPSGGARVKDKAVHTAHFIRNGTKLFRRHSSELLLPGFIAKQMAYLMAKSAYNRNPRILTLGLMALNEGLKTPV